MVLVLVGAWLLIPARATGRLGVRRQRTGRRIRGVDVAAAAAGLGVLALFPGLIGLVMAAVVAVAVWAGLRALPQADSNRADELARQAPDAVDCLAACIAAGSPLWTALPVVARAFGEPMGPILESCARRHEMGEGNDQIFEPLRSHPELLPVGRVLARSAESGSALGAALMSCADRLRSERAALLDRRARAVGVKAVGPLGLCFLPAFVLLAVVPIVGSMVTRLL